MKSRFPILHLLAGVCLVGAATFIASVPADAHGGHACNASMTGGKLPSGWACGRLAINHLDNVERRHVGFFYNGSTRGTGYVGMYEGTNDVHSVQVCDSISSDNIRPRITVKSVHGSTREFSAPERGGCRLYPGSQINMEINQYRVLTRTPSGALQHSSIWYRGPFTGSS